MAITKLDGTAKGGVVIGISEQFKIPVKYIGLGEGIEEFHEEPDVLHYAWKHTRTGMLLVPGMALRSSNLALMHGIRSFLADEDMNLLVVTED